MPLTIPIENFAEAFLNGQRMEPQYLDVGYEQPLPFRAVPRVGSDSLVVVFHGAVNRKSRSYPSFGRFYGGIAKRAHQLAFADPTLALRESLSIAWFAGSRKMPLQDVLVPTLDRLKQDLGVSRLIFVGGSGGGFAALYYSWHFPGSVAIVSSPQTIIANYGKDRLEQYYETAWPSGVKIEDNSPTVDLRDLYSNSMKNYVVYLQSQGDYRHLFDHMVPFLSTIPREFRDRIVTTVSYWGKPGHSGTVPAAESVAWIRSALAVEELNGETLREEFFRASANNVGQEHSARNDDSSRTENRTSAQINMPERLRLTQRLVRETLQRKDA